MISHGTQSGYTGGCRCPECTKAAATYEAVRQTRRYRVTGPLLVDARPWASCLTALHNAGVSLKTISGRTGVALEAVRRITDGRTTKTQRRTVERLAATVRPLIDARRAELTRQLAALDDAAAHLEYVTGREREDGMWPTAAVIEWAQNHGVALTTIPPMDRRYLYRNPVLSTVRAERVCDALMVFPEHVWGPAWFGGDTMEGAA